MTRSQSRKRKAGIPSTSNHNYGGSHVRASSTEILTFTNGNDAHHLNEQKVKKKRIAAENNSKNKTAKFPDGKESFGRDVTIFPGDQDQKLWNGPFVFAQLADTQLGCRTFDGSLDQELEIVDKGVSLLNALDPAFVIVCGDMINAFPDKVKKQDEQIAAFRKVTFNLARGFQLNITVILGYGKAPQEHSSGLRLRQSRYRKPTEP